MRLGVSAKIFLAYAVLLLAFAGNASFTVWSIHRARQGVVANQAYLDLQGSVDAAWKTLNDFAASLGRNLRKDPNLALAFRAARKHLDEALAAIERYLDREPGSFRRPDFEAKRRQLVSLRAEVDRVANQLATADIKGGSSGLDEFESQFANLTHGLNRMRRPLRGESGQIAQQLAEDEENALQVALVLGFLGLLVAALAAGIMWRTLRPLTILRARAREIAGGEYARRTGVRSRDEIGDLARELDAMAEAVEEREQRLIRSERLATVGRMASQITHEVRNPLASIGLYAELLGDELNDKPEARRLVTSIISEVDRLTEITETYLRFARLPKPKLEREDLGALVIAVAEFARAELAQAGIALTTEIGQGPLDVAADEGQIRQALLNLIRNAREAMTAGGRLWVRVAGIDSANVEVQIADTGPGISEQDLPKIFDPFFSTKAKGTGLGLAVVHQIVSEHGGRIRAEIPPEGGTVFRVRLPAWPGAVAGGAERATLSDGPSVRERGTGGDPEPAVHATADRRPTTLAR